jgi:hypothetical protein
MSTDMTEATTTASATVPTAAPTKAPTFETAPIYTYIDASTVAPTETAPDAMSTPSDLGCQTICNKGSKAGIDQNGCSRCVPQKNAVDGYTYLGEGQLRNPFTKERSPTIETHSHTRTMVHCIGACDAHNTHCIKHPNAPKCKNERRRCTGVEYKGLKKKCMLVGGPVDSMMLATTKQGQFDNIESAMLNV